MHAQHMHSTRPAHARRRAHRVDRRRLDPWVDVALRAHVRVAARDLRELVVGELPGGGQRTRLVELVGEEAARGTDAAREPVRE